MSLRSYVFTALSNGIYMAFGGEFIEKIEYYVKRKQNCVFAAYLTEAGVYFKIISEDDFDGHIDEYIASVDIDWEIESSQINSEIARKMAKELLESFEADVVMRWKEGRLDSQKSINALNKLFESMSPMFEPNSAEIDAVLKMGEEKPLSKDEKRRLLRKSLEMIKKNAEKRGDEVTLERLSGNIDVIIERILNEDE